MKKLILLITLALAAAIAKRIRNEPDYFFELRYNGPWQAFQSARRTGDWRGMIKGIRRSIFPPRIPADERAFYDAIVASLEP